MVLFVRLLLFSQVFSGVILEEVDGEIVLTREVIISFRIWDANGSKDCIFLLSPLFTSLPALPSLLPSLPLPALLFL